MQLTECSEQMSHAPVLLQAVNSMLDCGNRSASQTLYQCLRCSLENRFVGCPYLATLEYLLEQLVAPRCHDAGTAHVLLLQLHVLAASLASFFRHAVPHYALQQDAAHRAGLWEAILHHQVVHRLCRCQLALFGSPHGGSREVDAWSLPSAPAAPSSSTNRLVQRVAQSLANPIAIIVVNSSPNVLRDVDALGSDVDPSSPPHALVELRCRVWLACVDTIADARVPLGPVCRSAKRLELQRHADAVLRWTDCCGSPWVSGELAVTLLQASADVLSNHMSAEACEVCPSYVSALSSSGLWSAAVQSASEPSSATHHAAVGAIAASMRLMTSISSDGGGALSLLQSVLDVASLPQLTVTRRAELVDAILESVLEDVLLSPEAEFARCAVETYLSQLALSVSHRSPAPPEGASNARVLPPTAALQPQHQQHCEFRVLLRHCLLLIGSLRPQALPVPEDNDALDDLEEVMEEIRSANAQKLECWKRLGSFFSWVVEETEAFLHHHLTHETSREVFLAWLETLTVGTGDWEYAVDLDDVGGGDAGPPVLASWLCLERLLALEQTCCGAPLATNGGPWVHALRTLYCNDGEGSNGLLAVWPFRPDPTSSGAVVAEHWWCLNSVVLPLLLSCTFQSCVCGPWAKQNPAPNDSKRGCLAALVDSLLALAAAGVGPPDLGDLVLASVARLPDSSAVLVDGGRLFAAIRRMFQSAEGVRCLGRRTWGSIGTLCRSGRCLLWSAHASQFVATDIGLVSRLAPLERVAATAILFSEEMTVPHRIVVSVLHALGEAARQPLWHTHNSAIRSGGGDAEIRPSFAVEVASKYRAESEMELTELQATICSVSESALPQLSPLFVPFVTAIALSPSVKGTVLHVFLASAVAQYTAQHTAASGGGALDADELTLCARSASLYRHVLSGTNGDPLAVGYAHFVSWVVGQECSRHWYPGAAASFATAAADGLTSLVDCLPPRLLLEHLSQLVDYCIACFGGSAACDDDDGGADSAGTTCSAKVATSVGTLAVGVAAAVTGQEPGAIALVAGTLTESLLSHAEDNVQAARFMMRALRF